jgi:hypothetical protein
MCESMLFTVAIMTTACSAGGLRYPNSSDMTRALSLMAVYKRSIRSLHLMRLENLTGSDLMLLAASDSSDRIVMDDRTPERLSSSLPNGLEPLASRISMAPSSKALSSSGSSSCGSSRAWCFAHNLTAFSLMECSKVTDHELAAFFQATANLEFVALVPDDHVTSTGVSSAHRTTLLEEGGPARPVCPAAAYAQMPFVRHLDA